ncbi:MAG: phenylalanine--tRNA ligase subunit alpha [Firmicutes bacterium]|uniref:Phenylalanine--tRNA ligase alpha subunit n=1 Tax=Candidatus Gallilactobacillus intestinavium TaxID=2840838 RepID=A0A9D9E5F6_9LACO|nr:phenylalanine--tRNA ligase subunit alpha [Candidatus Gallilactobacillus intestinavium]
MDLLEQLKKLEKQIEKEINEAQDVQRLNEIRITYLGKKGEITHILRGLKDVSLEERPKIGSYANQVRDKVSNLISDKTNTIKKSDLNKKLLKETIDVTLPGRPFHNGHLHVIQKIIDEIEEIFLGLGYDIVDGYEVEDEKHNFTLLNIPKDHPARDMQDTFYLENGYLLRTQTSANQSRDLENHDFNKGPLKMLTPGKVYRRDTDDATHSHQFHQIEGLVVDHNITMSDLKGTLTIVTHALFGNDLSVRFRPSYFPFTEPSIEVDVTCFNCHGKGCSICKNTGWIETLGAGMVHPNVLEMSGIDSNIYQGFAFGLGPDRFAMLKYGINDIRTLYTNDIRFLNQFN